MRSGGSGAVDYRIKPAVPGQADFCGPAVTCNAGPADNLAVFGALEFVKPGDVIVAATDGYTGCAIVGDLLLGMARNCGAVAFVTDGCVRDIPGIRSVGIPVSASASRPIHPPRKVPVPWAFRSSSAA